jgi:hypothetical protein
MFHQGVKIRVIEIDATEPPPINDDNLGESGLSMPLQKHFSKLRLDLKSLQTRIWQQFPRHFFRSQDR